MAVERVSCASRRARPYVLFVANRWHPGRPDLVNDGFDQNFISTWAAIDRGSWDVWHPDAHLMASGRDLDDDAQAIDAYLTRRRPDLVMVTRFPWEKSVWWQWLQGVTASCRQHGVPVMAVWYDSVTDGDIALAEQVAPLVDGQIQIDRHVPPDGARDPGRYLSLWTVHDPRAFYTGAWERPQAVTCVGDWEQPVRRRIRAHLDIAGIVYTMTGGQRHTVDYQTYACSCRHSQMMLNTNNHPTRAQIKGHVFEATSCGALLLEQHYDTGGTHHLFVPYEEYVPFYSDDDLIGQIRHFQRHADQREAIARRGARAYWTRYSPMHFWARIGRFVWGTF